MSLVRRRIVLAILVIAMAGCEMPEPIITPPESTYTRVRAEVAVDGAAETADVAHVTPEFFRADGLQPILGRFFVDPEYQAGGSTVAVLSHAYWTERFKGTPAAIGSHVMVDGKRTVIVGVAPPQLQPGKPASVWIPKTGPM